MLFEGDDGGRDKRMKIYNRKKSSEATHKGDWRSR
jgi:hypothetical protein